MSAPAIAFEGVTKDFPLRGGSLRVRALDQLDLRVEPGSIVALMGPNGSGKSTVLKVALGLIRPDRGMVHVLGTSADSARGHVGYASDADGIPLHMTAREGLNWWGALNGFSKVDATQRTADALASVDLSEVADQRLGTFSKGMKQRYALAQAALPEPKILLLDEPFSGLDPLGVDQQAARFKRWREEGRTIVFSSHLLHRAEDLCDGVVLMNRGRILVQGSVEEIVAGSDVGSRGLDDVYREKLQNRNEVVS